MLVESGSEASESNPATSTNALFHRVMDMLDSSDFDEVDYTPPQFNMSRRMVVKV
jgi:hypothetical protein